MSPAFLSGQYDFELVALSYLVAILASYSAIDLAHRIFHNEAHQGLWLALGALAMGSGIWSMHFIGMQAFSLPIRMGYDLGITAFSLIAAIGVAALALFVASRRQMGIKAIVAGALMMGAGICVMHYSGMYAMQMQPGIIWNPLLVVASALVAVLASGVALWIVFRLRRVAARLQLSARIAAAMVMGFAVVGMHYTGMAAASFPSGSICGAANDLTSAWTAKPIAAFTILFIGLIMALAAYDARQQIRQKEARIRREHDERARAMALDDPETSLRNRASFQQEAVNFIQRCTRNRTRFDLFYGALRVEGDATQAMKVIAERLRPLARPQDFLARYGRCEFALLRVRDSGEGAPYLLRDQLLVACTLPMDIDDGVRINPHAHVGVGTFPEDGRTTRELLTAAARTVDFEAMDEAPARILRDTAA